MNNITNDKEYYQIVSDILNNKKFNRIKECRHHGITRYEHSLKVSYKAYKLAKKYNLDYISTARGGLLHDFFINEDLTKKEQRISMFIHPYKSLNNSNKYFNLNDKEKNIIISHMFPSLPHKIPLSKESLLVSIVDKVIASEEFYQSYGRIKVYKLSHIYMILLTIITRR